MKQETQHRRATCRPVDTVSLREKGKDAKLNITHKTHKHGEIKNYIQGSLKGHYINSAKNKNKAKEGPT